MTPPLRTCLLQKRKPAALRRRRRLSSPRGRAYLVGNETSAAVQQRGAMTSPLSAQRAKVQRPRLVKALLTTAAPLGTSTPPPHDGLARQVSPFDAQQYRGANRCIPSRLCSVATCQMHGSCPCATAGCSPARRNECVPASILNVTRVVFVIFRT